MLQLVSLVLILSRGKNLAIQMHLKFYKMIISVSIVEVFLTGKLKV